MQRFATFLFFFMFMKVPPSCNPDGDLWNTGYSQVTSILSDDEMIGLYRFTKRSIVDLAKDGYDLSHATLELKSDHQYVLVDGPSSFTYKPDVNETTIHTGTWKVTYESLSGCILELWGMSVVPLCEKDDRLSIPISLGPPDRCEGVVFEKNIERDHVFGK